MAGIKEKLNEIKAVEDTLTLNKVARFAYTEEAYETNDANGVSDYDVNRQQNIPVANSDILKVNETILSKGYRSQASSITRMLMNHFLGRISYNLNKLNDNMSGLLSGLSDSLGKPEGIATLDAEGRIPYSQLPESAMEYKGTWDASTNTPSLADGTGDTGDFYFVSAAGKQDLGSGEITFLEGDRVLYDGTVWQKLSGGSVKSVNEVEPDASGNITLDTFGTIEVTQGNITNIEGDNIHAESFQGSVAKFSDVQADKLTSNGDITCKGTLDVTEELNLKGVSVELLIKSALNSVVLNNWTAVTITEFGAYAIKSIAYANSRWIAVGDIGKASYSDDNGNTWTAISDIKFGTFIINTIAYGNSRWIAGGMSGKASYSGNNGKTWTAISDTKFGTTNFRSIAYANSRWIAVGDAGKAVYSDDNGNTWTTISDIKFGANAIYSIAYANSRWIAVGTSGKASYSDDNGETWTAISDTNFGTASIHSIAYGNSRWIAAGKSGKAFYSGDNGVTWTAMSGTGFGTNDITTIAYSNGVWVASGYPPTVFYSNDNGNTWTSVYKTKFKNARFNSIAYGNGRWIAAGDSGKAFYSLFTAENT